MDAILTGQDVRPTRPCVFCGVPGPEAHAIGIDVFGFPGLLCVFKPDPETVHSAGGSGQLKHWGHPLGCRSVGVTEVAGRRYGTNYGHYLFGEPMTTIDALERGWCSPCADSARSRLFEFREEIGASSRTTGEAVRDAMSRSDYYRFDAAALHILLDRTRDRSREEMQLEARAGTLGLSVEEFRLAHPQMV